jgi:hypothetical protein
MVVMNLLSKKWRAQSPVPLHGSFDDLDHGVHGDGVFAHHDLGGLIGGNLWHFRRADALTHQVEGLLLHQVVELVFEVGLLVFLAEDAKGTHAIAPDDTE